MPSDPDTSQTDEMALSPQDSLAARTRRYCDEIERVVRTVGEHPQYELKRALDLSNLRQRMEFVKDIQSIATSAIDTEKFLIIGADETRRQFVPVSNVQDFDEAKLSQQLERYLAPVPKFEVFRLQTSDDIPFVLFVIGKQPTRRILARVTVDDLSDLKPRILLREGDLWTKGDSTGKRLARPEDWDAIYEAAIEREAESRTRTRTDHVVQQVIAQERIRTISGSSFALPAYLSDDEFKLLAEDICARNDTGRLSVLVERLRDDLIEGWHKHKAYTEDLFFSNPGMIADFRIACMNYRDNTFRPAIQRIILLAISIVKNRASITLFEQVIELIRETYATSDHLHALRISTPRSSRSKDLDGHLSQTTVALESLIAIYVVGAYITKRRRFDYLRLLLAKEVLMSGLDWDRQTNTYPMAMWPLHTIWGEPEALRYRAGRIDLCVAKVIQDATIALFFGNEDGARSALIQFEFLVELNSFLAVDESGSPDTTKYMRENYPKTNFSFWPSLIAFDPRHFAGFAVELFADFDSQVAAPLSEILRDPNEAKILGMSGKEIYLRFVRDLQEQHAKLMLELNHFPGYVSWPQKIQEAFKALPRKRTQ